MLHTQTGTHTTHTHTALINTIFTIMTRTGNRVYSIVWMVADAMMVVCTDIPHTHSSLFFRYASGCVPLLLCVVATVAVVVGAAAAVAVAVER